jgi:DNA-binding SARP family transcriptional activator
MSALTIQLFGKFSVRRNGNCVNGLEACKLQELVSHILVFRRSPHSRESLAALLWADSSTAQSRKYLRQALWRIQSVFEPEEQHARLFNVEPDWISVNPDFDLDLDVSAFEDVFSLVREIAGHELDESQASMLDRAIQLYQGDLLEGWYQDWCIAERERLQTNYLIMLDKMMNYCQAREKYETAISHGLRVLRYDRARESTHRRLMRLHYLAGDRTAALRQYEHCTTALGEELGVEPSRLTVALYDQIRLDEFHKTPGAALPADGEPPALHSALDRLKDVRRMLIKICGQVQKDIKAVEDALNGWR